MVKNKKEKRINGKKLINTNKNEKNDEKKTTKKKFSMPEKLITRKIKAKLICCCCCCVCVCPSSLSSFSSCVVLEGDRWSATRRSSNDIVVDVVGEWDTKEKWMRCVSCVVYVLLNIKGSFSVMKWFIINFTCFSLN